MIRIFKLILLLVISQVALAQAPSNYTNINGRYRWIAGMFDSTFHIPKGTNPSLRTGGSTNAGALFYKTGDSSLYIYTGTQWLKQAGTAGFVPYSGATQNVNLGQFGLTTKWLQFDTSSQAVTDRRLQWSNDEGTLQFGMTNGATITQRIGLEQFARVKNVSGSQINKGQAVYIFGASGDRASVKLADNRADSTSSKTLGVATEDIANNDVGLVGTFGQVGNLDLSAFTAGDILYLDSIPGALTNVKPQAPYHLVFIGVVERANSGNGLLFVNPQNGYELEELHNVRITTPVNNKAILMYDSVARLWKDTTVAGAGLAVTSVATNTGTGITGGTITTTGTLAIDTLLISTRAWRQKGVDSLQANINLKLNISDTASMLANYITGPQNQSGPMARFSGNGTIDTSRIFQNNGLIGINTTGPSYSLDVLGTGRITSNTYLATSSGVVGIGTTSADSLLTVQTGAWVKRGLRLSGLPTGTGTKSLRVDANGTVSLADTLTNGISGTGTTNYIPKFTSSSAIGNSIMSEGSGVINVTGNIAATDVEATNQFITSGGNLRIVNSGGQVGMNWTSASGGDLYFRTGNSERMRLDASGNLGLGTTTFGTYGKLSVAGGITILNDNNAKLEIGRYSAGVSNSYIKLGANSNSLRFTNNADNADLMELTNSGNLGLGVTPSAWGSGYTAFQMEKTGFMADDAVIWMYANGYFNGSDNIYLSNGYASRYYQANGQHIWNNAPSGTAGTAISFTQAMTLDASGRLGIGTTNPLYRLQVTGTSTSLIKMSNTSANRGIIFGVDGSSEPSIQAVIDNSDVARQLSINPSGGNVGIGTTSPNYLLDLQTTSTYVTNNLKVNASAAANNYAEIAFQLWSGAGSGENVFGGSGTSRPSAVIRALSEDNAAKGALLFATFNGGATNANLTEKMRITSGGELLINTTSDAGDYKLQVNGRSYFYNDVDFIGESIINGNNWYLKTTALNTDLAINYNGKSTADLIFYSGTTEKFRVSDAGNTSMAGSITTAAPSGGTAKPWKLGEAGVSVGGANSTAVKVEIDGVVYYLLTAYLPEPAPEPAPKPKPEG